MGRPIKATMANLKKYGDKTGGRHRGVMMYSPKTGERYSANAGDYFQYPANYEFKGFYLGVPVQGIAPLTGTRKKKSTGSWSKKKTIKRRK
jgi:hypothetical protein